MKEQVLMRYLDHSCTPDELIEVEQWIKEDKSHADYIFEAEHLWNLKHRIYYSNDIILDKTFSNINKKIHTHKPVIKRETGKRTDYFWWYAGIAATIAVLLIMNLMKNVSDSQGYKVLAQNWNTLIVPNGQQSSLILSDGTKVTINSGSIFRYPSQFNNSERNVELKGEALFVVNHDGAHPFVVNTEKLLIKDLGTVFNLKAYPSEKIEVTLAEGKVEVESKDRTNKITMNPNEQVIFSDETGMILKQVPDARQNSLWTKGIGIYNNMKLINICTDLERRFNVKIAIEDPSLHNVLFTCHYQNGSSIRQIMDLLKYTRKLDYSLNKNKIVITKP